MSLLVVQLLLIQYVSVLLVESSQDSVSPMDVMPILMMAGEESNVNLNGDLYIASEDDNVWVVSFNALTSKAMLKRFQLSNNGTGISLMQTDVGSGDQLLFSKSNRELVYDVLHHYAYIAVGTQILIIHLNTSEGPSLYYETLEVAHTPTSVKALTFNGDTYLLVTYTTQNDRGYVKRFRRYKSGWGRYGELVLVTTPSWFNVNRVSDILLFKATDALGDYNTLWVAVAEQWIIYAINLIDGTQRSYESPQPCDNIERLVYSDHRQRMLVQCREATALFDASKKEFYAVWPEATGEVHIAESGQYGAVINKSQSITFLNLHQDYQSTSVRVKGEISNVTFVDASSTQHYFCYTVQLNETCSVKCINIELLFQNSSTDVYTSELFNSSLAQIDSVYSHHNLLAIQQTICSEESCLPFLQLFDMITLINSYNVTGIHASFLAFKAVPFDPPTLTPLTTEVPVTQELTTDKHIIPSSSMPTTTELLTEVMRISTTPVQDSGDGELYLQCTGELENSKKSYEHLLWITVVLGSLFSLALLVTILLLMVLCVASKSNRITTETVILERYTSVDKPPAYSDQEYTVT